MDDKDRFRSDYQKRFEDVEIRRNKAIELSPDGKVAAARDHPDYPEAGVSTKLYSNFQ